MTPSTNIRRIITKPSNIRQAIHEKVLEAVRKKFPVAGRNFTAKLVNATVKFSELSHGKQSELLLSRHNATDGVYADIDIVENSSGRTVGRLINKRICNIPYYTNRYTLMLDGNEYAVVSQMRTKSGVYTRKRGNDEIESSFNLAKGANFKLIMDPDTGIFKIDILNATLLAVAVLKILGAGGQDILNALGKELAEKNLGQLTDSQLNRARTTLYDKLVRYRKDGPGELVSAEEKDSAIRTYFNGTAIDPETTAITLGKPFSSVGPMSILEAMKKILAVYKGTEDIDERDMLEFQKIHTVEDLLAETIDKSSEITTKLRQRLDKLRLTDGKISDDALGKALAPDTFTRPLRRFITGSSLSRMPSQINPMEFVDTASIITRLGEGAISSDRAVPFGTRAVNYSYMGLIDPIAAPESFKVGIDAHCTFGALKGSDNEFYKEVVDCRTGERTTKRSIDLYDSYLGFPDPVYNKGERKPTDDMAAIYRGKLVHVPRSRLDYQIASPHDLATVTTNTLPFMPANQGNRLLMGDKHIQQALPLKEPEKRLVKAVLGDASKYKSTVDALGSWTLPTSPVDGTVEKIDDEYVYIKDARGKMHAVDYENNLALATKTFLHNDITVKPGESVKTGQPLGGSGFSKDGELTMGRNLRIAYMPFHGLNHEDGVVLSESAAKKMTSVHSDKITLVVSRNIVMGKDKYRTAFPTTFSAAQLAKLDDEGLAKKGAVLEEGDPIILAMEDNSGSKVNQVLGMLHKSLRHPYRDRAEVYDQHYQATVVAVASTPSVKTVVLRIEKPLQLGDKIAGSYGNKGVCAKILPDDQMPRDEDGNVLDGIFTSAGVISRINPAQILESALGKVAKKTGKVYEIENYSKPDYVKFVKDELKKHNVSDTETLTDPVTGKKIPGVFVGVQHCHKLFKTTDTNFAARGIDGGYDQDDAPSGNGITGPKALGGMEVNALIAHNARSLLREGTVLRGARNLDFWKQFQSGLHPTMPDEKKTFTRFIAILKQAGINVTRKDNELVAAPLTDKDVLKLSSGELRNGLMLSAKALRPEAGGLFDPTITGGIQGTRWAHIKLVEPVVNPVFTDAVRSLLRMGRNDLQEMIVKQGGTAIRDALNRIDVTKELKESEDAVYEGKLGKADLDKAVKRVKYLRALRDMDMKPGDAYIMSVVPVTPPVMRPITVGATGDMMTNDADFLYRDLILQNNSFRSMKASGAFGQKDIEENRTALNTRMRELAGLVAPGDPQLRGRSVKGALDFIAGDTPKGGYFQHKVIYGKMNLTGRATISPDTTLGLDEIGLPEETAWRMYSPFVMRRLAPIGYTPLQAREAIEEKSPAAVKALKEDMDKRPVIVNRAPTLWRHGIMAAKPLLRSGKNLRVNSIWEKGLNADYDGDAMQIHLPVSDEAIEEAKRMFPSRQLFTDKKAGDLLQAPTREPIIGLYKVTENVGKPQGNAKVHRFPDVDTAWKAYYAGKLKMTDYVDIG